MPIIKLYFKIIKNGLPTIFFYLIIFLLSVYINSSGFLKNNHDVQIGVINENATSRLTRNFVEYLDRYGDVYFYHEENKELEEDLFHGKINVVVTIPYQFGERFLAGEDVSITLQAKDNVGEIEFFIEEYLSYCKNYLTNTETIDEETLLNFVSKELEEKNVTIINMQAVSSSYSSYYNMAAYILMVCILYGVNFVMRTYEDRDIQRRITLSLQDENKMKKQIFLGNFIFTMAMIFLFILTDRIINKEMPYTVGAFLIQVKFILYALSSLALGYLIASLVHKREIQTTIIHILPLIIALFSGVLIPRENLKGIVLKISVFMPMHWFINGNASLGEIDSFQLKVLKEFFFDSIHIFSFLVAIFAFVLLIEKYKKQMEYS